MERNFHYRGDLRATALPEMLFTIYRTRINGVVEAAREGIVKEIFIKEGDVIHASSTNREDSLGAYLLRTGRLTTDDFSRAMHEREGSGSRRLGELLVDQGLLSPAVIYQAIREQIESIVWSLFAWEEGEVSFRIGESLPADTVRILVPTRQVIVQGVKRAANAKAVVARLGRRDTLFEPAYKIEDLIELALDENETKLLRMVNGKRSLYDLCTNGPHSPAENGKLLYAYHVLQIIKKSASDEVPGVIKIKLRTDAG